MYEPCDIRNVAKKINSGKRDVQNSENKFKTELGNLAFSWHGNASKAFVQGYSESGCEINRLYSGINNLEYGLTRLATEVKRADDERRRLEAEKRRRERMMKKLITNKK